MTAGGPPDRHSSEVRRLIERLGLAPHPEGGFYREVYRSELEVEHPALPDGARRAAGTHIYFLLPAGDRSAFHRVRASDEIWHLYAGGPLELHLIHPDGRHEERLLASDLERGEPVAIVPAGAWQAARPAPGTPWALAGATVAPGFDFADFDLPPAEELARRFPEHEELVLELGRSASKARGPRGGRPR